MKARAVWSLLGRKKIRNAVSSKFNKMVKYEKDVERVHLEDPRIEWSTNENYDNVEVCKIAGINIPEESFHLVRDPAGWKSRRDKKHLKMVERLNRRQKVQMIKAKTAVDKPEFTTRQLSVAEMIRDALNSILTNDIVATPDPNGMSAKGTGERRSREGEGGAGIVAPSLALAVVRFTQVEITKDLGSATCWWECRPGFEMQVRNNLSMFKKQIRYLLGDIVKLKFSPILTFKQVEGSLLTVDSNRALDMVAEELKKPKLSIPEDKIPSIPLTTKSGIYADVLRDFSKSRNVSAQETEQHLHNSFESALQRLRSRKPTEPHTETETKSYMQTVLKRTREPVEGREAIAATLKQVFNRRSAIRE